MLKKLVYVSTIFILTFMTGCSTFNQAWKKNGPALSSTNDMSGRWVGVWKSAPSGHTDKLKCIMTKEDETHYKAWFHAKYRKIFTFEYTVNLTANKNGDEFKFEGEANLGKLAGGVYHYLGTATPEDLKATYSCKYDHGVFELQRPKK